MAFLFYLGLGILFSHELDAMLQAEWRLLYILRAMPDESAMQAFVLLHVPLFGAIVWMTHHRSQQMQLRFRVAFAAFLVIHAGLHYRLSSHPLYMFTSVLSQSLIYGGAVVGTLFLLLSLLAYRRELPREA